MGFIATQKNGNRNILLLMRLIYTLGIHFYNVLISIAALKNKKAALWKQGRKNWKEKLKQLPINKDIYWFHSASLGEFEQGRPLIEAIKQSTPDVFILLTFFSPSGYEIRKNYPYADAIMYLPSDTLKNAKYFVDTVGPQKVFFIKYEFWFNYINAIQKTEAKLYSISTIFRKKQIFFKPWGKWFKKHLFYFDQFFVQNITSQEILNHSGLKNHTLSGDTRYDRVKSIADDPINIQEIELFAKNHFTIVAGSTWNEEIDLLIELANKHAEKYRFVIAPHELSEKTYKKIETRCNNKVIRLSNANSENVREAQILIIDCIGLLSKIYRYGHIALIGGGFGKGIHNILEPSVYGMPVIFGPNYKKFHEAVTMVDLSIAFEVKTYDEFERIVDKFYSDKLFLKSQSKETENFVKTQLGASSIILSKTV